MKLLHYVKVEPAEMQKRKLEMFISSSPVFNHNRRRRKINTKVLQGSAATRVNYGRIFIDSFTANLLQSVMVKEF